MKSSLSTSESLASRSSNMPIAGKPPVKTVGNVIVKILGVKYMSATRPSFEVWLGSQVEAFQFMGLEDDGSSTEEFEGFFSLGDLTSDIVVLIKEEYSVGGKSKDGGNFVGRVVIPITSYLTLKGRSPPKKEWMAVYPIGNPKVRGMSLPAGAKIVMFLSRTCPYSLSCATCQFICSEPDGGIRGWSQRAASFWPCKVEAVPRISVSLKGFISCDCSDTVLIEIMCLFSCVQIELLLPEGPVYRQYLEGEPPRENRRVVTPVRIK